MSDPRIERLTKIGQIYDLPTVELVNVVVGKVPEGHPLIREIYAEKWRRLFNADNHDTLIDAVGDILPLADLLVGTYEMENKNPELTEKLRAIVDRAKGLIDKHHRFGEHDVDYYYGRLREQRNERALVKARGEDDDAV